jgi:hypothetical protein
MAEQIRGGRDLFSGGRNERGAAPRYSAFSLRSLLKLEHASA